MRILYISQYFYPEMGAASARVHELSRHWVRLGHSVTVLTCFPNYPDGVIYESYKAKSKKPYLREKIDGINVLRILTYPTHLRSTLRRSLNYLSFFISSSITVPFLKKYDIVIATSPPLFIGLTGLWFSWLKSTPLVFEVRDLWPEVISAVGAGDKNSISYKIFDTIASILYKKSDVIVALTNSFKHTITSERKIPSEKVKVIENAVDSDIFKPASLTSDATRELELHNKFVVSYIGTIGLTHGVEVILRAAEELKETRPEIVFLIVGDGYDKERLIKLKVQKGLNNVIFTDKQPRTKIPLFINASDILLVLSTGNPLFKQTIFAKVFEPMACGKPIIVGVEGETKSIVVDRANAGIDFKPEDSSGLIEAIIKLYDDPQKRMELGENGKNFVISQFSRLKKAKEYLEVFEDILKTDIDAIPQTKI